MNSSSSFLPVVLALLAGAVGGAVASYALLPTTTRAEGGGEQEASPGTDAVSRNDLEQVVRALEGLEGRVQELELRPSTTVRSPAGGAASPEDLAALRAELEEVKRAGGNPAVVQDLEETIAGAVQSLRDGEALVEALEASKAGPAEITRLMTSYLGLSEVQAGQVRDLYEEMAERGQQAMKDWASGTGGSLIEVTKKIEEESQIRLEQLLYPEQVEKLRMARKSASGGN